MKKSVSRERLTLVRSKSSEAKGAKSPSSAKSPVGASATAGPAPSEVIVARGELLPRVIAGTITLIAGLWAYWPTLEVIVGAWEREADYSHGYLVVPAAVLFLWMRRASLPQITSPAWLTGFALVGTSLLVRLFAAAYFFESIDGWSILLWLAGVVALLFGNPVLRWALPSIAFLFFMIPLPFRLEGALSLPLQRIATKLSVWTLQLLGQSAISEGNTILLGDHRLEVAQACSGLRLFMSISALAFAYLMIVQRAWWERGMLLVSVVPIAIIANSARIVCTGLLFEYASSEVGEQFSHDFAGWAMIPLAAALFGAVLWYLGKLFREQEQLALGEVIRRAELR